MSKVFDGGIHVGNNTPTGASINELTIGGGIAISGDTTMINNSDINLPGTSELNSTNTTASTSAATGAIHTSGGIGVGANSFFGGEIDMDGNKIVDGPAIAGAFTVASDYVTKAYVDASITGLNILTPAISSTVSDILADAVYNDGAQTITSNINEDINGEASLDTITSSLVVGSRILVKDLDDTVSNGVYEVTTVGSGAAQWVLTRTADLNTGTDAFQAFILVQEGTINGGNGYVQQNNVNVGSPNTLKWVQFSQAGQNLAGTLSKGNDTGGTTINISDVLSGITSSAGVDLNVTSGTGSSANVTAGAGGSASLVTTTSTSTGGVSISSGVASSTTSGAITLTTGTSVTGSGLVSVTTGTVSGTGNSGAYSVTTGAASNGVGGAISLTVGSSGGTNAGSDVTITAGAGGSGGTSVGGDVIIVSGASTSTGGASGAVSISSGTPTDGNGGAVSITAAAGVGTNRDGGEITITAGNSTGNGTGGSIMYMTGDGTATGGAGGAYSVQTGDGVGAAAGAITLTGGNSDTSTAGAITLTGGNGTGLAGVAGAVQLEGGTGSGTNAVGGAISLTSGAGNETGASGDITLTAANHGAGTGAAGSIVLTAGDTTGSNTGGNVTITAGNRQSTGGNVTLVAGTGTTDGDVEFTAHGATIPMNGSGADASLATTAQNIVGAINELNTAVGAVVQRIAYSLVVLEVRVIASATINISYFSWDDSRYGAGGSNYTNGLFVFETDNTNRTASNVTVELFDITNTVSLGTSGALTTSGIQTFAVTAPAADARVAVRVTGNGSSGLGDYMSVFGCSLEWDATIP